MKTRNVLRVAALTAYIAGGTLTGQTTLSVPKASEESGYHLSRTIPIGGDGTWDYLTVDSKARRLYITRATHVVVMDVDSYRVVGDIPGTEGVHGVALVEEYGRGYTSNGKANTATIFDLSSLKVLGTVKTGTGPDGILYDPYSRRVFTFNHGSNDVTAINASDGTVVGTLPLHDRPEAAVADGKGNVFVNIPGKSQILEFDAQSLVETHRWPLNCTEPSPLAISQSSRRLFSACEDRILGIVDADHGKVVASAPIGAHVDAAEFDPDTGLAFVASAEGTLAVVHEESSGEFSVLPSVPTKFGARTLAVDRKTHSVFLATADFDPPLPGEKRPQIRPNSFVVLMVSR